MSEPNLEMHLKLKGRVQGVGFRSFAKHTGLNMGITGTVRNLEDGSVEIYAQGSKEKLEIFEQVIKENFTIDEVALHFSDVFQEFVDKDFKIIY